MFEIDKYWQIIVRRKYWIIIPFLVTILGGLGYGLKAQRMYEAKTVILVLPQKVPEAYVHSIVSSDISARIKTITEQVTSRSNLERVISEFKLFQKQGRDLGMEEKVKIMRNRIRISVSRVDRGREASAFSIAFRNEVPRLAMEVADDLASNFISQDIKIRESQAGGTARFLSDELDSMRRRLHKREEELKAYREKHMGEMPEHLNANIATLGRLQMQLDQLNNNLRDAENRKLIIQDQISKAKEQRENNQTLESAMGSSHSGQGESANSLPAMKQQLAMLEARYTSKYPDVIRLRKTIERLEAEEVKSQEKASENQTQKSRGGRGSKYATSAQAMDDPLTLQLTQVDLGIKSIKDDIKDVSAKINFYQRRVEDTPKREQQWTSLSRGYSNLKETYSSLLNRELEAQIALSMEKQQKGEQFRVIDPAQLPQKPISPDFRKIIFLVIALGIGLGGGMAYLVETMDTSYKTPEEVEQELQMPVMVEIPMRFSEKEIRRAKVMGTLKAISIVAGFFVSVAGIVIVTKGIENTIIFVKTIITNVLT